MDQEKHSWAERRQRMVRCKIHGLHYDPQMSSGCTRCLKEAAKAQPRRSPQLTLILLCLLGMAIILYQIFGAPREDVPSQIRNPGSFGARDTVKLDAERHRQSLTTLEQALYATPVESVEDLELLSADLSRLASSLSATLLALDPAHGGAAADAVARWGQSIPDDQFDLEDLERARLQWRSLRRQYFTPAPWFTDATAAAKASGTPAVERYSTIADRLASLLEEGIREARALETEDRLAAGDPEADVEDRWPSLQRDWRQQIDSLRRELPGRPDSRDSDQRLVAAVQSLEGALSAAGSAVSRAHPDGIEQRLEALLDQVESTRRIFEDLI